MNVNGLKMIPAVVALLALPLFGQRDNVPSGLPGALPTGVKPPMLEGVGVEEKLGRDIDLNLTFIAENGYPVKLSDYFHKGRPVILNLIYYSCPMLCNLILNGQTQVMREIPWTPGKEYEVVTISIDPHESFDLARKKKETYLNTYDRPAPGWHFLCDQDGNAKKLAEQIGFHYRYDSQQNQFAHAAAIFILTPEGKMSRYLYGVRYHARDVRFALAEASENKTSMTIERVLLFCYHYDPTTNAYVMFASNFMRAGGILTVLILGVFLFRMIRMEQRRTKVREAIAKEGLA